MTRPDLTSRGFTLLEVMVAALICGMALAATFGAISEGTRAARAARQYEEAVSRARSHLAAAADTGRLRSGAQRGDDGGGFAWSVDVREIDTSAARFVSDEDLHRFGDRTQVRSLMALYEVAATERWGDGGQSRSVRLVSMRMQPVFGR